MNGDESIKIAKSLAAPEALTDLIARHYGLPGAHCRLIKGTMRDTYLVTAGATRYVAMVYRCGARTMHEIAAELAILDQLSAAGLTVPQPLRTVSSEPLVQIRFPEGARSLALFTFLEGAMLPRTATPAEAAAVGRALAALHTALDQVSAEVERPPLDLAHLIDAPLAAMRQYLDGADPRRLRLTAIADFCREHLSALPTSGPGYGLIHGDVIPSNMLVDDQGILALLDFDLCGPGWRVYDLASYLHELEFWDAPTVSESAFMGAYEAQRPLADWERQALPAFRAVRSLVALGIPATHVDEWGSSALSASLIERLLALAEGRVSKSTPPRRCRLN